LEPTHVQVHIAVVIRHRRARVGDAHGIGSLPSEVENGSGNVRE
jgi:hypothetical protein